jgi:hypothetical protein
MRSLRKPIYEHYLQGRGTFGHSQQGQSHGIIDLIVDVMERKSKIEDYESMSYTVPDEATANIFASIQMRFGLVPERWIIWLVRCLGVDRLMRGIWTTLWLRCSIRLCSFRASNASMKATREEEDGWIWIEYCLVFISYIFMCILGIYCTEF